MTHFPIVGRTSVGSLDDDQFYSAQSSRIASRHASLSAAPRNLQDEAAHVVMPSEPLVSVCQPGRSAPTPPPEAQSPPPMTAPKSRWAIPFSMRHHHNPKHRHFCPRPLGRRFHRTFHGTSDSIPLLQPLRSESGIDSIEFTKPLISSPASPNVDRRNSVYAGSPSPRSERSSSSDPTNIDQQGTDAIVSTIRAYLSSRRHNDCLPQINVSATNENYPPLKLQTVQDALRKGRLGPDEMIADTYLVTTDDIAGILDIVISGIRSIHRGRYAAKCLSMLLPKESLPKPSPNITAIVPGSPSIADPATTISSVQPSFSVTGCSGNHRHYLDASRTTFISRQSITEVT
ncbi:uncharacterized protein GGS22DRAFT_96149 [Annulohypoxylon maeteangense]|uniref:uncharacterized protein n=1 Tax=Annulohypoxylon maeteangense TaxID=1927788 RepID=UPI00200794BE|nr:uncharacterized protein GGS22DRAFT_96149 [Annulohypoxylon maeteangense]KAI0888337.1 hypothetical protein GGS22DRAFT_96149 [Annulohypoxylon maeteangense]